ncbi:uncharacterized protein BCR38DRAFT_468857 [Pseudomassariella vexata]|uniref:Rhodopsin domain-containing protein n=1 Tax=Pseudomassariella vexata TaxID=1141098 RepID=A0A1Y2DGG5_9PEZI|nr:uncharacterized protein BCR38DRAFT_468857 [Pseudomassariella vexata]ORY58206.1 hypothetical protein BCR38DRAFT_468857 [Pseudomassariella vexata]
MADFEADPNVPLRGSASHVNALGLTAIVWIGFIVATLFVILRISVRWRGNGKLGTDDYWILLAWSNLLTMAIIQTQQMESLWYTAYLIAERIAPDEGNVYQAEQLARWEFPIIQLFWTTLWCIKGSFLALFFGLVKPITLYRRLWYGVVVFTVGAYIGCWLGSTLTCDPPLDYFKPGKCNSPKERWLTFFGVVFSTAVDITSDLMIMSLPLALLPKLHLEIRQKVGLGLTFSISCIIIGVSIVRLKQAIVGEIVDIVGLAIWGAVEASTAVIVGSLPPLKAFLSKGIKAHTTKKSSQNYGNSARQNEYNRYCILRTIMAPALIPLHDLNKNRHSQSKGRICMQKTYDLQHHMRPVHDYAFISRDDDEEAAIIKHMWGG